MNARGSAPNSSPLTQPSQPGEFNNFCLHQPRRRHFHARSLLFDQLALLELLDYNSQTDSPVGQHFYQRITSTTSLAFSFFRSPKRPCSRVERPPLATQASPSPTVPPSSTTRNSVLHPTTALPPRLASPTAQSLTRQPARPLPLSTQNSALTRLKPPSRSQAVQQGITPSEHQLQLSLSAPLACCRGRAHWWPLADALRRECLARRGDVGQQSEQRERYSSTGKGLKDYRLLSGVGTAQHSFSTAE